jgi:hypothetical protein
MGQNNLTLLFTSKKCSSCRKLIEVNDFCKNKTKKYGLDNRCKECKHTVDHEYMINHKEEKTEYDKNRRSNETQEDKNKRNDRRRELYKQNPEGRSNQNKKWKKKNPDKIRIQTQNKRARDNDITQGEFTSDDWEYIQNMFDHRCAYCTNNEKSLTIDHYIPVSNPECVHDKHYIVPACPNCNSKKSSRIWKTVIHNEEIDEFYKEAFEIGEKYLTLRPLINKVGE